MGATNFSTVSFGKTANDAFQAAQNEARHAYGHDGYTGSIAEKSNFSKFATPKGASFKAMINWLQAAIMAAIYEAEANYSGTTPKQAKADRARAKKHWNKIPAAMRLLAREMADTHDDKWGPAICIELTGKADADMRRRCNMKGRKGSFYYFAGMASE